MGAIDQRVILSVALMVHIRKTLLADCDIRTHLGNAIGQIPAVTDGECPEYFGFHLVTRYRFNGYRFNGCSPWLPAADLLDKTLQLRLSSTSFDQHTPVVIFHPSRNAEFPGYPVNKWTESDTLYPAPHMDPVNLYLTCLMNGAGRYHCFIC